MLEIDQVEMHATGWGWVRQVRVSLPASSRQHSTWSSKGRFTCQMRDFVSAGKFLLVFCANQGRNLRFLPHPQHPHILARPESF